MTNIRGYQSLAFWLAALLALLPLACKVKKTSRDRRRPVAGARGGAKTTGRTALSAGRYKPSRRISQVWTKGTTHYYGLRKGGKEIGFSWGRYVGAVTHKGRKAHKFRCKTSLSMAKLGMPTMPDLKVVSELYTDDRGRALHHQLRTNMLGLSTLDFTEKGVALKTMGRSRLLKLPYAMPLLTNNHVLHLEIFLTLLDLKPDRRRAFKIFSTNVGIPIDYIFETKPGGRAGELLLIDNFGETITLAGGKITKIVQKTAGITVTLEKRGEPHVHLGVQKPLTYHRPKNANWRDREVGVPGRDVPLAGTLSLPVKPGKHPAVLFWSGSGVQDRHGFTGLWDTGSWELLDHLSSQGFAVLRMDDRGTGKTAVGKKPGEQGFWSMVDDARAALRFLARQREVDKSKLFLIGHSEGGMVVTLLASGAIKPAGVVLMAAPARNLIELMGEQQENLFLKNLPPVKAAKHRARFKAMVEAIRSGRKPDPKMVPPGEWQKRSGSLKWFADHSRLDIKSHIRRLRCPVLIVQGEKDVQVHPVKDARVLARELRAAGNSMVKLKLFPGLDHLFKLEKGRSTIKAYLDRSRRVDRGFLKVVARWLKKRAARR